MLGRVSSVFLTVNAGARPVGAAIGAVVGASWGEAACLWLAAAGFVLQAVVIFASSLSGLRRLPAAGAVKPRPRARPGQDRCLPTMPASSNIVTCGLPKTGSNLPSALIARLFFASCKPLALM